MTENNFQTREAERKEAEEEFGRQIELCDGEENHEHEARMARREGALKMHELWLRGLHLLRTYKGNRAMAMDCFFMTIGKGDEIDFEDAVQIAKHYGVTKQTVTKCIKYFQDRIGIPPMPGQRSEKGCKEMSDVRRGQLKNEN